MAVTTAHSGVRSMSIEATVLRADGRVERLGAVCFYHKNPLRRLAWRLGRLFRHVS
jgi:hypothetical protein